MYKVIRYNPNGMNETIYRHEKKKTVERYLDLVILKNNNLFASEVNYFDGCKGAKVLKGKYTYYYKVIKG